MDEQGEKLYFFTKNKAEKKLTLHLLPLNEKSDSKDRFDVFDEVKSKNYYVFSSNAFNYLEHILMKGAKDKLSTVT